jgi:hypothetical protein
MMVKKNKLDCIVEKKTAVDLSSNKKKAIAIVNKNKGGKK